MAYRMKLSQPLGSFEERAKVAIAIKKVDDACDKVIFDFINSKKLAEDKKRLDDYLATAGKKFRSLMVEQNKVEGTDFDPVIESVERIKKYTDKITKKIQLEARRELNLHLSTVDQAIKKSQKKFSESFVGKLFNDIDLPEASKARKASPLDHQVTGNFGSNSMLYIGNKPPDPIQLELLKTQQVILHHLQNQNPPEKQTPEQHKASEKRVSTALEQIIKPRYRKWIKGEIKRGPLKRA